jgi:hypothetical protein
MYTPGFFIMFFICSRSDKGIWRQCPYDDLPKRDSVMYVAKLQVEKWQFGKTFELASAPCGSHLHILVGGKTSFKLAKVLGFEASNI